MEFSKYEVKPFSGKNYAKNSSLSPGQTSPCAICGKSIKHPWPHQAIVINGGSNWGDLNSDENDPGYMGCWPIGNNCHKKYVKG